MCGNFTGRSRHTSESITGTIFFTGFDTNTKLMSWNYWNSVYKFLGWIIQKLNKIFLLHYNYISQLIDLGYDTTAYIFSTKQIEITESKSYLRDILIIQRLIFCISLSRVIFRVSFRQNIPCTIFISGENVKSINTFYWMLCTYRSTRTCIMYIFNSL